MTARIWLIYTLIGLVVYQLQASSVQVRDGHRSPVRVAPAKFSVIGACVPLNLANRITIARIFFIPVVISLLLIRYQFWSFTINHRTTTGSEILAALVFIGVAGTDALDGYVARKKKQITTFGKFLDPLADKLLVSAVLISLVEMGRLSAWVAIVIISREFVVTGLRLVAAAEGIVLAASRIAKWKTGIQIVTMVALIINNFPFSVVAIPFDTIMVYIMVAITIYSGIDYFVKNKQLINVEM